MKFYWLFDEWLIDFVDGVGLKMQTQDKIHYVDLVCRAGLFLLVVSTLGAAAENPPGTPLFWMAVTPYFVAWVFIINMIIKLYKDRKNWTYAAIGKNMDRALRMRHSLRGLRLLLWLFIVGFGVVPALLALTGLFGDGAHRLSAMWSAMAATLVTNGTALLFLYVFCILPAAYIGQR